MDLKEQDILGDSIATHWYYVAKAKAMLSLLRGVRAESVLDVGAGSGVFSRKLIDAGVCRTAICVDLGYERDHCEPYNGGELKFVRAHGGGHHDLILMMDVLEHVDDDAALLREYAELLRPGGQVLISVPAFEMLWSGHDDFLEHRRRYTRRMLEQAVTSAGLIVERSQFFFGLLFPVVAAIRMYEGRKRKRGNTVARSALRQHSSFVNSILVLVHDLERWTVFPVNRVAGLTLFCAARTRQSRAGG